MTHSIPSESIVEILRSYSTQDDKVAFRFLDKNGFEVDSITYHELFARALSVAEKLKGKGEKGSTIMLLYPPSIEYIVSLFASFLAGFIAVPLYPPNKKRLDVLTNILNDSHCKLILTTEQVVNSSLSQSVFDGVDCEAPEVIVSDKFEFNSVDSFQLAKFRPHTITAFIQYTSGSTGKPKGVAISHRNIVENTRHLTHSSGATSDEVFVNWLPLFHDLGLVTGVFLPIYLRATAVLMAPITFIQKPELWFQSIERYNATVAGAPNFAFDLCAERISPEQFSSEALSSWRIAFNAAEPVRAETLERFVQRFSTIGFEKSSVFPAYGMAESTAFVSGGPSDNTYIKLIADTDELANNRFVEATCEARHTTELIGCGQIRDSHPVRIMSTSTGEILKDGEIGEIQVAGGSVSEGYWNKAELNAQVFNILVDDADTQTRRFYATGDLGFLWKNEIFIAGRIKDIIIINGVNYYPHDIELCAAKVNSALSSDSTIATETSAGNVVLILEVSRNQIKHLDYPEVATQIRNCVFQQAGLRLADVIFVKPFSLPKTSSGKVQRSKSRDLLLKGQLPIITGSPSQNNDTPAPVVKLSDTESTLVSVIRKLIGIDEFDIHQDFVDTGFDSLKLIEFAALLPQRFNGVSISLEELDTFSSVHQLAAYIDYKIAYKKGASSLPSAQNKRVVL